MSEFKSWREIEKFQGVHVQITEKLNGTNGVILIEEENGVLKATPGSRTRFLDPVHGSDNYGFGAFVKANEQEICEKLGQGYHYGEWIGPGINGGGYDLKEKHFVLFDRRRNPPEKPLPPRFGVVPLLYDGVFTDAIVETVLEDLKKSGSKYSPGYMAVEGIVLFFPQFGVMKKKVFTAEETAWKKAKQPKDPNAPKIDFMEIARPYLQPIRLEKLLTRDETYKTGYPATLPTIVRAYIDDLVKETPTEELTEDILKAIKKVVYVFVKEVIEDNKLVSNG